MRALLLLCSMMVLPAAAEPVNFVLRDLEGREHRLSDHRGRWVVVSLWATWCPPCRTQLAELTAFREARPEVVALGINFEHVPPARLRAFLGAYRVNYPILRMKPGPRGPFGLVRGLPTTYLVSPEGEVVHQHTGVADRRLLARWMARFGGA